MHAYIVYPPSPCLPHVLYAQPTPLTRRYLQPLKPAARNPTIFLANQDSKFSSTQEYLSQLLKGPNLLVLLKVPQALYSRITQSTTQVSQSSQLFKSSIIQLLEGLNLPNYSRVPIASIYTNVPRSTTQGSQPIFSYYQGPASHLLKGPILFVLSKIP